jgi:biopolymer transport protein ExbD
MRQRRPRPAAPIFTFAPMVDIVLLLLVFFMTTTSFLKSERGLKVDLPSASQASSSKPAPEVVLTKTGQILFEKRVNLTPLQLEQALKTVFKGAPSVVSLRADRYALHGRVVEVMNAINRAGATRLAVAVQERP